MLHSKAVIKGLGGGKNVFNTTLLTCSLTFQLFQTDEAFTVNSCKHTYTHTHTHTHTHTPETPSVFEMDGTTSVDGAISMATKERQSPFPLLRYEFR